MMHVASAILAATPTTTDPLAGLEAILNGIPLLGPILSSVVSIVGNLLGNLLGGGLLNL